MKSGNFGKNYKNLSNSIGPRSNRRDLWIDILTYSSNMTGNWLLSKQIFYTSILPTAERNPVLFAQWVHEMVEKSGIKIKSKAEFIEALDYLGKFDGRINKIGIRKALYHLFQAGLGESEYANRALANSA